MSAHNTTEYNTTAFSPGTEPPLSPIQNIGIVVHNYPKFKRSIAYNSRLDPVSFAFPYIITMIAFGKNFSSPLTKRGIQVLNFHKYRLDNLMRHEYEGSS